MRVRPTFLIFAVVVVLLAWFFIVERPADERKQLQSDDVHNLVNVDLATATEIRIARPADTLLLKMVDTHWEIIEPLHDLAYQGSPGRLLKALSDAAIDRDLGSSEGYSVYGLAPPEITIRIRSQEGPLLSLDVGNFTTDKYSIYARKANTESVVLTSPTIRRAALYDLEDWRNRRVLNFDLSTVTAFTVTVNRRAMRWQRVGDTWWTVERGDSVLGQTKAVEGVLRRVRGLRVRRFPDPTEYDDRFLDSNFRIEIEKESPAPDQGFSMILSAAPYPFVQTAHDGRVVETDSSVIRVFDQTTWDLRDKRPIRFDPAHVTRIEVHTPDTTATLVLRGTEWSSPNPSVSQFDQGRVRIFLRSIAALSFASRPQGGEKPARKPIFNLVLYRSDATLIDEFSCYEGDVPDVWVSYSTTVGMTTISAESVRRLADRLKLIRKADNP